MEREEIKKIVWKAFTDFTGLEGNQNLNLEVYSWTRERFVRRLRELFPELRLRNSDGKVKVSDFVDALFAESIHKDKMFAEALQKAREVTKHPEYTLDSIPYEGRVHDVNYGLDEMKLATVLYKYFDYNPYFTTFENCKTLRDKCELLYRRGQF